MVGASPGKSAYPNLVLRNLRAHNFAGKVVVVHPRHGEVDGYAAVPTISAVEPRPDLCIIAVRAELVPDLLRECVARGVPAVTVIAAGFAEQNTPEGRALQAELVRILGDGATRLVGPNCLGVASFATRCVGIASGNIPGQVPAGRTAIVSQSGGVSLAIMLRGLGQGLGLNHLVSVGNEIDVSAAEWITALAERDDVRAILCYLEGIRDVGQFRSAVEACNARGKPVVILRGGATLKGKAAAASHTGALSGDGAVWQSFLAQTGAIGARSIDHAIAVLRLFQTFGRAGGRAVGGFGGGGGLTVLFTDLLSSAGIDTPALAPRTQEVVRRALPDVTPHNPMEMGGLFLSGDGTALEEALTALAGDPQIDALALCVPPYLEERDRQINGAIVRATANLAKPTVIISYAPPASPSVLKDAGRFILEPPEAGVLGLKSWLDYQPASVAAEPRSPAATRTGDAGSFLGDLAARGETTVLEDAAKSLLRRYGMDCPDEQVVADGEAAAAVAERLGYPVALKILAPDMLHRGIGKGVLLNLPDRARLLDGFATLQRSAQGLRDARILVQAMAQPGMELLLGAVRDPELGLALAVAMGGVDVEAKREVMFCIPPISHDALRQLLDGWAPLREARKRHGEIDVDALLTQIVRFAALLDDARDVIDEADVNPVIVGRPGEGAVAVDALFLLRPAAGRQDS